MKNLFFILATLFSISGLSKAQTVENLTFGTDNSLEVITWNIEFFPHNDELTIDRLSSIIPALDADIIAFQEIADVDVFNQMINNIDGYDASVGTTDDLIKLAFVYKTDVIQTMNIYEIYTGDEYSLPFLRRPLVMECTYKGEHFVVINNHFKALGDGILDINNSSDEENRRWVATNLIKEYIDNNFPTENVIIVGDLNDISTDEYANNVFQSIIDDPNNYAFADEDIAVGSSTNWSYPDYPSHIDHIIITNEIFDEFYAHSSSINTLKIEEYLAGGWDEYTQNISDHRPVAIKIFTDETVVFNKDFEDQSITSGGWTSHNITGAQTWTVPDTQYGNNNSYCAYMSGYENGALENENWFISPAFSTEEFNNLRLSFWNTSAYSGPGLQLLWSHEYTGDPTTTIWTEIDKAQWHDGNNNWVWTFSEILDLSNATGTSAHIAFKYTSTSLQSATWELDDILLADAGNILFISAGLSSSSGGTISGTGAYIYGETVWLSATPENNFSFVNWTENGEIVSTDVDYSFTASQNRSLTANFTNATDINALESANYTISPNPASEYISLNNRKKVDVKIYSLNGVCVVRHNNINPNGSINISNLNNGVYIISLKTENNTICKKLIIDN